MRFKEKHILAVTLVAVFSTFGLLIYGLRSNAAYPFKSNQDSMDTIIIADAQQPIFGVIYVAEQKGFFEKEGINVVYRKFQSGKDALNDVLDGNSHLAGAYENPIVRSIMDDQDIVIITSLSSSRNNTAMVVKNTDSVKSVSDLRGKKVMLSVNTNTEMLCDSILSEYKMTLSDVEIVNSNSSEIPDLFFSDETVAAAVVWNIRFLQVVRMFDEKDLQIHYSPVYSDITSLVGKREYVMQNERQVKKVLRALLAAKNYMQKYPEESWDIINSTLPVLYSAEETRMMPDYEVRLTLDNVFLASLYKEARWMIEEERVSSLNNPNIRNFIVKDYLESIDPDLVTI